MGSVDDLETEPVTRVATGEDAVPVIFSVESGSRTTVLPFANVITALDESVVIVSPDTSG
jgi:hypothetical protein